MNFQFIILEKIIQVQAPSPYFSKKMITLSPSKAHSLRRFICILLLLVVALQSFHKVGIILAFKMNQDYIANALCENKDKPQMHCNGRCVLAKKLKQAEQNEEKQRSQNQEKANVLFFCKMNRIKVAGCLSSMQKRDFNPFYLHFKPSSFSNDIFKPPQFRTV